MIMKIKALREACGITQQQLADSAGVARNAVSTWESEVSLPKTRELPRLAKILGCSINDLFESERKT